MKETPNGVNRWTKRFQLVTYAGSAFAVIWGAAYWSSERVLLNLDARNDRRYPTRAEEKTLFNEMAVRIDQSEESWIRRDKHQIAMLDSNAVAIARIALVQGDVTNQLVEINRTIHKIGALWPSLP